MLRFAANLSFLYQEMPFAGRFAAASRDGFEAVEYMSPYEVPAQEVAGLLRANGLTQALLNLPAGDWAGGERGIACLPDRVDEFRAGVEAALAYARALGCTKLNCLAGLAPQGADAERLEATLVDNLRHAAARLAEEGVKLLIEPISLRDVPGFLLSRTDHAARIVEAVGSDNLFIQYDLYHAQVMQGDLVPTFERLRHRIAHVQLADTPGRHEPGTGEINFAFVLRELDRLGYDGFIGCEYKPKAGTSAGLAWREPFLRENQS